MTKNKARKMFGFVMLLIVALGAMYHYVYNNDMTSLIIGLFFIFLATDIASFVLFNDEGIKENMAFFILQIIQIIVLLVLYELGKLEGFWFWLYLLGTNWIAHNAYRKLRMVMKESAAEMTNSQSHEPNL